MAPPKKQSRKIYDISTRHPQWVETEKRPDERESNVKQPSSNPWSCPFWLLPGVSYQLGEELGRGEFGVVYKARDAITGLQLAVKIFKIDPETADIDRKVREIKNVVDLLAYIRGGVSIQIHVPNILLSRRGSVGEHANIIGSLIS